MSSKKKGKQNRGKKRSRDDEDEGDGSKEDDSCGGHQNSAGTKSSCKPKRSRRTPEQMKEDYEKQEKMKDGGKTTLGQCAVCEKCYQISTGHTCKGLGKRDVQILKCGLASKVRRDEYYPHIMGAIHDRVKPHGHVNLFGTLLYEMYVQRVCSDPMLVERRHELITQNTVKQTLSLMTSTCRLHLDNANVLYRTFVDSFLPALGLTEDEWTGFDVPKGMSSSVFQYDAKQLLTNFITSIKMNFSSRLANWIRMQLENHVPSFFNLKWTVKESVVNRLVSETLGLDIHTHAASAMQTFIDNHRDAITAAVNDITSQHSLANIYGQYIKTTDAWKSGTQDPANDDEIVDDNIRHPELDLLAWSHWINAQMEVDNEQRRAWNERVQSRRLHKKLHTVYHLTPLGSFIPSSILLRTQDIPDVMEDAFRRLQQQKASDSPDTFTPEQMPVFTEWDMFESTYRKQRAKCYDGFFRRKGHTATKRIFVALVTDGVSASFKFSVEKRDDVETKSSVKCALPTKASSKHAKRSAKIKQQKAAETPLRPQDFGHHAGGFTHIMSIDTNRRNLLVAVVRELNFDDGSKLDDQHIHNLLRCSKNTKTIKVSNKEWQQWRGTYGRELAREDRLRKNKEVACIIRDIPTCRTARLVQLQTHVQYIWKHFAALTDFYTKRVHRREHLDAYIRKSTSMEKLMEKLFSSISSQDRVLVLLGDGQFDVASAGHGATVSGAVLYKEMKSRGIRVRWQDEFRSSKLNPCHHVEGLEITNRRETALPDPHRLPHSLVLNADNKSKYQLRLRKLKESRLRNRRNRALTESSAMFVSEMNVRTRFGVTSCKRKQDPQDPDCCCTFSKYRRSANPWGIRLCPIKGCNILWNRDRSACFVMQYMFLYSVFVSPTGMFPPEHQRPPPRAKPVVTTTSSVDDVAGSKESMD